MAAPPSRRKLASAVGPSHFSLADGRVLGGDGVWATGHSPFSPPTIAGCARTPPHVGSAQLAVSVRADSSWAASPSGQFAPKLPPGINRCRYLGCGCDCYVPTSVHDGAICKTCFHPHTWHKPRVMAVRPQS